MNLIIENMAIVLNIVPHTKETVSLECFVMKQVSSQGPNDSYISTLMLVLIYLSKKIDESQRNDLSI